MEAHERALLRIDVDAAEGESPTVRLSGDLDVTNADRLSRCLIELADRDTDIVVDMSDLQLMDSSGLTALIRARHRAVQRGRTITVRRAPPMVALVLAINGQDRLFNIEP
jgi:anti-sigma B factor antagonist